MVSEQEKKKGLEKGEKKMERKMAAKLKNWNEIQGMQSAFIERGSHEEIAFKLQQGLLKANSNSNNYNVQGSTGLVYPVIKAKTKTFWQQMCGENNPAKL